MLGFPISHHAEKAQRAPLATSTFSHGMLDSSRAHPVIVAQSTVIDLLTFFGTSGWTPWSAIPRRSR